MRKSALIMSLLLFTVSCNKIEVDTRKRIHQDARGPEFVRSEIIEEAIFSSVLEDSISFINLSILAPYIIQELCYADTNNFTHQKIYDCPACFLQNEVAAALVLAQEKVDSLGLGLKVFDCYRSFDSQVKLYEAFPDFNYVAKPTQGSMHSFGCAVDLTLIDAQGKELNMGTDFDSFDKRSYTFNTEIDSLAQSNRMLLRKIMMEVGFQGIKTEWWHFSFVACNKQVNTNLKWTCP